MKDIQILITHSRLLNVSLTTGDRLFPSVACTNMNYSNFFRSHKMDFVPDLNLTSGVAWRIWKYSSELLDYLHVSLNAGEMLLPSVACTSMNYSNFFGSIK